MSSNKVTSSTAEHLLGRVKWFNNKAGFGFLTVTDGTRSGTDVFVHHSAINVENQQYKYLVQGEYVEFDLIKVESDKHEWQASGVSGIKGGKLMCETRHDLKLARNEYKSTKTDSATDTEPKMPKQKTSAPRVRGEGPRDSAKGDWTLVTKGKPKQQTGTQKTVKAAKGSTIITIQSK